LSNTPAFAAAGRLREIGQAHAEGLKYHPVHDHPWASVLALCHKAGWHPGRVLSMDAEVFAAWAAYLSGRAKAKR